MDREGRGSEWLGGGEEFDQNTFEIVLDNKKYNKIQQIPFIFELKNQKEWINIKIIYIAAYLPLYWFYKKRLLMIYRIILLTKIQISNFRLFSQIKITYIFM